MEKLKNNYLWLVFALALLGGTLAYFSSEQGLVSETVTILDDKGKQTTVSRIKTAPAAWILSILSSFTFTMAISLFISIFVMNRLDKAMAKEEEEKLKSIRNAINVDVFDSLFKTLVPAEIFEVFKNDVISNKIVRKNANWIYDFRETGTGEEIELTQTIKYELHNVSQDNVSDAIHAKFDGHGLGNGIRRAVCMFDTEEVASFDSDSINRNPPQQDESITSKDGKVTINRTPDGHSELIINVDIPPNKKIDVTLVYLTFYDNFYVNDGYFTKYPMINASLMASYPKEYEFEIFQALSSEMKRTLKEDNRSIFEVKGGILPHQGFIYSLKRKRSLVAVKNDCDVNRA